MADAADYSKRPQDTKYKQQRLRIWQPVITTQTFLPTIFIVGILLIPVGIILLYFSFSVNEFAVDYSNCRKVGEPEVICWQHLAANPGSTCQCKIDFELNTDFKRDVYMYYGLSNYYQNHRLYVKSRDDEQLMGKLSEKASSHCRPFLMNGSRTIVPCGAIANSLFNDTLTLQYQGEEVPLLNTGIAWPSDKEIKFRNPPGDLRTALENYSKPLFWQKELWQLDPENPSNNGLENEDFIVWMRTAYYPVFRKLYRRIDHSQTGYQNGLKNGSYTLNVLFHYPVHSFKGTKTMILSNTSVMGGKNPFPGVMYIVTGCALLCIGSVLFFVHLKHTKIVKPL